MLFNVEADRGSEVVAYLVLDDFASPSRIALRAGGKEAIVEANDVREALVGAGRHETGRCAFRLNASHFAEIAAPDLELREPKTNLLLYRRRPPKAVDRKILRLETHLLPLWRFDDYVIPPFQYSMSRIEHYGRETVTQMFMLHQLKSEYISGRILYKNYEAFVENGFSVWTCVQNPYWELAERILFLKSFKTVSLHLLSERDRIGLEPVIAFAQRLPLNDSKALKKELKAMPHDVAVKLSNPLVRQLTVSGPDDLPIGGAVASALSTLSNFQLVGFRHSSEDFVAAAAQLLDLPVSGAPLCGPFPLARDLASMLEETGAVESILEKDLELFYHLIQAEAAAATAEGDA